MITTRTDQIMDTDGVDDIMGFITVSESFLRDTYTLVKADLDDLVTRYKQWDSSRSVQEQIR